MIIKTSEFSDVRILDDIVEMLCCTEMCGKCGRVKIVVVKYHIVLQALSSLRIHRGNLKVYV